MNADPNPAKAIFLEAVERHAPEQWPAFLDRACAGQPDLRGRVEALLEAHREVGTAPHCELAKGADAGPVATVDAPPVRERPGDVIGPYKLLEPIGEGGFGVVFLAEQTEPVRRKVALKVLKPGMDTRQVVARFEAERQALAIMDHPNIAKVFDGGATPSGRPYFVMELVKGVPITEFCDQNHLTPRQRLELFIPVCQAVQHAHQKGIIHRDLKPSNVLVSRHDTTPVVKVIDFGVAKALGQVLTDKTLFTGIAQMVGTPLYMSPEQAGMSDLDIDTRSDVYSLGVLLYELLTGTTPFTRERFQRAAYDEIRRIIREEDPPRPSTRLSESKDSLPSISVLRHTEPGKLTKLVRGELDWIVMKALEKDRNRRYETANGFAMDVQRYLADEPVQACPPSAVYRFKKFARRNKGGLAVAALVLFFLVVLGSGVGWIVRDRAARIAAIDHEAELAVHEANRHEEQRQWSEALSAAKRADGLLGNEGSEDLRRRVRDLRRDLEMVIKMEQIRDEVMDEVADDSKITFDITQADRKYFRAFAEYGIDIDSIPVEEAARRLRARSIAAELAAALDNWALARSNLAQGDNSWQRLIVLAKAADPDEWRGRLRDAWARKDRPALQALAASEQVHRLPPHTLYLLGVTLREVGDLDGAVAFLRKAQQLHPDDFWINMQLVNYYLWEVTSTQRETRRDEAMRYAMAANAVRKQSAVPYRYLAGLLDFKGRLDEAIAAGREAIRLKPNYQVAHHNLGVALQKRGQRDEAIAAYREAIRHGAGWAWPYAALARVLSEKGNTTEAEAAIREALRLSPKSPDVLWLVGEALSNLKKPDEAISHLRTAIELDPKDAASHNALGFVLRAQKKLDEAIAAYRKAIELDPGSHSAYENLGNALLDQKKLDEAIAAYRKAIELGPECAHACNNLAWVLATCPEAKFRDPSQAVVLAKQAAELDPKQPAYLNTLGAAHYRAGDWKAAIAALNRSVEQVGENAFDGLFLAMAHWQLGHKEEARAWYDRAVAWTDKHDPKNDELLRFRAEAEELMKEEPGKEPDRP